MIGTGEFMSYNLSRCANICLISSAYVNRRQIISLESHGLFCEIKLYILKFNAVLAKLVTLLSASSKNNCNSYINSSHSALPSAVDSTKFFWLEFIFTVVFTKDLFYYPHISLYSSHFKTRNITI